MNQTAIYMTDTEAKLYIKFLKYRDMFDKLELCGALPIINGSITLSFDSAGKLSIIEKREVVRC